MILLDGKGLAKEIKDDLKIKIARMNVKPKLVTVQVGDDFASSKYVASKGRACEEIGMLYDTYKLDQNTEATELLKLIDKLNADSTVTGILVQMPLPKHINSGEVINRISPTKDVDGFHPINVGKLSMGQDGFVPCTPNGVMRLLEKYKIPVEGKNAVIVGRSNIVGKPMAMLLLNTNATVTICHSKTENLSNITKQADILIAAVGKPNIITANLIKDGAVLIDVGINRDSEGNLCGDINFESCKQKASYITPVPGGVGPMTIAMLLKNCTKGDFI